MINFNRADAFLILFLSVILLTSCEKVINLDLDSGEKKYVIEGVLTDQPGTTKVLISQTKDFDEDNNFPGVPGATVSITESGGTTTLLTPTSSGVYEAPNLVGVVGKDYTLSVSVNGSSFTAVSTMSTRVNLDSIFVTDEFLFTDTRKIVNAVYKDPPGRGDNYRFIQYVNRVKENKVLVQNDDYTDGRMVTAKLFYFSDDEDDVGIINSGDTVRIDMLCIDPAVFRYWFSLDRSATGGSGQATPSNPVSNLQGGALGYFSAHTLQTKSMVVP
ncbi:MAG: DUF4249 domain-containing protein [Chitinophagaceae bacterium]|nr:DUF4249 domain-containing protein [Chitinophagaceae bacterium]